MNNQINDHPKQYLRVTHNVPFSVDRYVTEV
uniref:Uncharacterized protein n=1 Tax=Anguilla anguilla TaxID=7936 RepID=A0A0E9T3A8_ANGAN